MADRDKKLSTDILNRSSTVWLIEEAKDKIEPASVNESRQAKPPKNLNTKTDEKLLRRRFSTLKSDQLEFSSNKIVNKKEIVIKDERKVTISLVQCNECENVLINDRLFICYRS